MERKTITAENLAEARKLKSLFQESSRRKGLTQAQMAIELGISQGAVSHYLNGKNALNLRAAVAFSRCIGCPVGDFSPRLAQELGSAAVNQNGIHSVIAVPSDADALLTLWVSLKPASRKAILLIMQSLAIADQQEPV